MMDDANLNSFESELRRLTPAAPNSALLRRIRQAGSRARAVSPLRRDPARSWLNLLKWLMPATASGMALVLVTSLLWTAGQNEPDRALPAPSRTLIKADQVHIDRELVASFQTVAESPEGLPVRFELQEWMDRVTFRDTSRGIIVEQRSPRVEIVPVRFESY
jgi:hypothetical protein